MSSIARNILFTLLIYAGIMATVFCTYHLLGVILPVAEVDPRLQPAHHRLLAEDLTGKLFLWCPELSDWVDISGVCGGGAGCDIEPLIVPGVPHDN
jgi:hypothetical protein